MSARYRATHSDPVTTQLRRDGWHPKASYGCGCDPDRICQQHAHIRATEHDNPALIP